ncbi:MAG TPA: formate dehydrogenase accessory protein FdhE [Nitrospirota bacterium]|nr:formate dehydrogenase accessory protein FdhE [Nitrospirota bacterium]
MKVAIEDIIREKPHLTDPFRFYQKAVKFTESVRGLRLPARLEMHSYPRESVDRVFEIFSAIFEFPEGTLAPLKQAMGLNEIDLTRLPLGEIPAFSLPYPEDDLTMLLFLIGKPYFLGLREAVSLDKRVWEEGRCPVCSAQPSIAWIEGEGRRQISCSFCGTVGYHERIGCMICQNSEGPKQNVFVFQGESAFRLNTCDACRSYVKTIDAGMLSRIGPEVADLMSLPLDIVVQEKGFERRSPNPIGMRKISTHG